MCSALHRVSHNLSFTCVSPALPPPPLPPSLLQLLARFAGLRTWITRFLQGLHGALRCGDEHLPINNLIQAVLEVTKFMMACGMFAGHHELKDLVVAMFMLLDGESDDVPLVRGMGVVGAVSCRKSLLGWCCAVLCCIVQVPGMKTDVAPRYRAFVALLSVWGRLVQ